MLTFLVIGGIGVVLLLVSLVVGDFLDGVLDFGGDLFGAEALAGFLGAFGFAGAIAMDSTDSLGTSILVGLAAGAVIGGLAGWATSILKKGGDESNVRSSSLTGRHGTVISAIPAEGYGQVSVTVAGHITTLNARCPGGLPAGTPVTVTAVLSPTSVSVAARD